MAEITYGSEPILSGYWPYGGFPDIVPGGGVGSGVWVPGGADTTSLETGDDPGSVVWEPGDSV